MTDTTLWTWTFKEADGTDVPAEPAAPTFGAQVDAEAWIGEHFEQLRSDGVDLVDLMHGDTTVYSMSLHAPEG